MLLATRQAHAAFPYPGLIPIRERHDTFVHLGRLGGILQLLLGSTKFAVSDIIRNAVVEQYTVLYDEIITQGKDNRSKIAGLT